MHMVYKHIMACHLNIVWVCNKCYVFTHNNLASFHAHLKEKHDKPKSCSKACVEHDESKSDDKSKEKEAEEGGSAEEDSSSRSSLDSNESEEDSTCGSGGDEGQKGDNSEQEGLCL